MLTVTQKKHDHSGNDIVIGYFDSLEDIYNHFKVIYKWEMWRIAERFSHDPCERFKTTVWSMDYCYVVTNYKGIRYGRSVIQDAFRKIHGYGCYRYWHGGVFHSRGSHYRRIKTTQERRINAGRIAEEGEPPIRGSRLPKILPSYWDDVQHTDYKDRSWKRYRSQQWKQ